MTEQMLIQWALVALFAVFGASIVVLMVLSLRLDFMQEARRSRGRSYCSSCGRSTGHFAHCSKHVSETGGE